MKKIIALLMTLALLISALALPAFAEEGNETVDQVTSATTATAQGAPNGQQPPIMPGNGQNNQGGPNGQQPPMMPGNGQNGQGGPNGQQPPAMPGNGQNNQNNQNGQQPPEMPGSGQNSQNDQNSQQTTETSGNKQNSQNGQDNQNGQQPPEMPGNGQNDRKGGKPQGGRGKKGSADQNASGGEPEKLLDFEQLVKDGVISQEVCDAILNYMKEHAPQGQTGGTAPADGNAPAQGSEPPAKPDGDQNAPGGMEAQLLQELLDNSVITQEIYDLLLGLLTTTDATAETAVAGA